MAITQRDLDISNISYTNKDFAQIYPELLDLCNKLTNQWNPDQSNESDPGIVLLKLAAFIADKNNYNIDKNILECFMPSATQESSMRNLCEMNGYNMKYYRSAITPVSFMYTNDLNYNDSFVLKKYDTVITSEDGGIKYTLISDCTISKTNDTYSANAIEGTIKTLSIGDANVIQLYNIDDNNRIYFQDKYVAENGVFITDSNNLFWAKKDNLNVETLGQAIYKFGYDSSRMLPYIEFPSDIASLIGDGLIIRYIISSGNAGNVSTNTLTVLSTPDTVTTVQGENITDLVDNLIISNLYATNDGMDPETINEAYSNFKRTVGTFNNLVTCRDYANFIYNLVDETTLKYIVSNIHVADRRTDLNYSNNIVTYDIAKGKYVMHAEDSDKIKPFDLCLYPLSPMGSSYNKATYDKSFLPLSSDIVETDPNLSQAKCISHNFKQLDTSDIYCIKNKYKLNVKLATNEKVNLTQQDLIINNVKNALYRNFNSRQLEFGEEIPYDSILSAIQNADSSISSVILSEPEVTPYIMNLSGDELPLNSSGVNDQFAIESRANIIAKNVLSGTISLFDINKNYNLEFGQRAPSNHSSIYPNIIEAKTEVKISHQNNLKYNYVLRDNELIQFIAPNLVTETEFGSYVNYKFEPDPTKEYNLLISEPYDFSSNYGNYYKIIDDEYEILTEAESFEANTFYSWDGSYIHSRFIPSKTYYQLSGDEKLSFVYTDAETNIEHTVVYTATTKSVDGALTTGITNIFYSSFDVCSVEDSGNSLIINKNNIKYLQLGNSDIIAKKTFVSTTLDNAMLPCYWIMNNANNTLFDTNNIVNGKISVILDNGEYFMYSNNASTELVILGSGTKLTLDLSVFSDISNVKNWNITSDNMVDIETINDKGLAAFADVNWQYKQLNITPLKIEDMQFKTFTAGNSVWFEDVSSDLVELDNNWQQLKGTLNPDDPYIKYNTDGNEIALSTFKNITYEGAPLYWEARSKLSLSCGPNRAQNILSHQNIDLKDINGNIYNIGGYFSEDLKLSFNLDIEHLGSGEWFDIRSKKVENIIISLTDGVEGMLYNNVDIKYPESDLETYSNTAMQKNKEGMLIVSLEGFGPSLASYTEQDADDFSINLPFINFGNLNIINNNEIIQSINKEELIFMYYDVGSDSAEHSAVTVSSSGLIKFYGEQSASNSLTLNSGINIIAIPKQSTASSITISHSLPSTDVLYIGNLNLINGLNKVIPSDEEENILNKISSLATVDGINMFNYIDNIIKGRELDVDNMLSADAFWDKNNIANSFTIGQIDFDNSTFNIVKSSQK